VTLSHWNTLFDGGEEWGGGGQLMHQQMALTTAPKRRVWVDHKPAHVARTRRSRRRRHCRRRLGTRGVHWTEHGGRRRRPVQRGRVVCRDGVAWRASSPRCRTDPSLRGGCGCKQASCCRRDALGCGLPTATTAAHPWLWCLRSVETRSSSQRCCERVHDAAKYRRCGWNGIRSASSRGTAAATAAATSEGKRARGASNLLCER
jgi:hypothetical protein